MYEKKRCDEVLRIPIEELCDLRCKDGLSFQQIASKYNLNKIIIYGYYKEWAQKDYGGYDPIDRKKVTQFCKDSKYTVPEIAKKMGITSVNALKNYIADFNIPGREPNARAVVRMRRCGRSECYMAAYFGLSQPAFNRWCKYNGIEVPRKNSPEMQRELREAQLGIEN